jgi:hypothetical protein
MKSKRLDRFAAMGAKAIGQTAQTQRSAAFAHAKFPDWTSVNLLQLFGLEKEVQNMKKQLKSAYLGKSVVDTIQDAVNNFTSTVGALTAGINSLLSAIDALGNANVSAQFLYIPPVDGVTTITVAGNQYTLPKATYGNAGFIDILRSATNAPTDSFVAGFVCMVGSGIPGVATLFDGATGPEGIVQLLNGGGNFTVAKLEAFIQSVNAAASAHEALLSKFRAFKK